MGDQTDSRWSLHGMTALVTGGTTGIGHATVEELAKLGASVYTCSWNADELNECLQKWALRGLPVNGSVCDVKSRAQREDLMTKVSHHFNSKLNILVNNVGTTIVKPTTEYTAEEYSSIMATNLESGYHLSQLAYPLLKSSGAGSIVFLSSVAVVVSVGGTGSIYGITKGALSQLAKNLACEWAKDNIRSNAVAPTFIKTPLTDPLLGDEKYEAVIGRTPLGRVGEPKDVSSVIAFLCLLLGIMPLKGNLLVFPFWWLVDHKLMELLHHLLTFYYLIYSILMPYLSF